MAQIFWNIPNTSGPDYEVGLYHGEKSGHVIIYSGTAILRIAFAVTTTASYSFLLGETLYMIRLTHTEEEWKYMIESAADGQQFIPLKPSQNEKTFLADAFKITMVILLALLLLAGYFYFVAG